ncbi:MAG: hypothetical protein BJ554DRAFT_4117, partial [Olpidium bornovanus]
ALCPPAVTGKEKEAGRKQKENAFAARPAGPAPAARPPAAPRVLPRSFVRRAHLGAPPPAAEEAGRHVHLSNLPLRWTFLELQDVYRPFGPIADVRVARRASDGAPLGRAVVTFENDADARTAAEATDGQKLESRVLRAAASREETVRVPPLPAGLETVVRVANLAPGCTPTELCSFYSVYGRVVDACVFFSRTGSQWNTDGFLRFSSREAAELARKGIATDASAADSERHAAADFSVNDVLTGDENVHVTNFSSKTTPSAIGKFFRKFGDVTRLSFPSGTAPSAEASVVEVRNLARRVKEAAVMEAFQQFGPVEKVLIAKEYTHGIRSTSFVWFKTPDDAQRAVDQGESLKICGSPVLLQRDIGGLPRLRLRLSESPASFRRGVYSRYDLLSV